MTLHTFPGIAALPYPALVVDQDRRIVFANDAAKEWLEYPDLLEDTTCAQALHPDLGIPPQCPLGQAKASGKPVGIEAFDDQSGRTYHCGIYAVPQEHPDRRLYVHTFEDITERSEREKRLRQSEERHRRLVEGSPYGIAIIDEKDLIRYANRAAALVMGSGEADALVGHRATEFVPPEFLEEMRKSATIEGEGRSGRPIEKAVVCADGREIQVEAAAIPFEYEGEPAAYVVFHDITRRKQAQEELRRSREQLLHAQKLESVGQLAGGIAHDFNNLLTVIAGDLQLLLDDARIRDPDLRSQLQEIQAAAARANDLTGQLLAFSRQQPYRPRVVDLNAALAHMDTLLRRTMGEDKFVRTALQEGLWPVEVDPMRLEQIILNLAINARDAMGYGGALTLETQNLTISQGETDPRVGVPAGEYVLLTVADDGKGMDEATAARIFEPFFTTKSEGKGTGLGLSTVYGIVKQLGGFIYVESVPDEGTTFRIHFPRSHDAVNWIPPGNDAAGSIQDQDNRGTETVLIVEDEISVRRLAARILSKKGYDVFTAASGPEAVDLARTHTPGIDLLLTDVVLPLMTGRDVAATLRDLLPDLTVLYMSGYAKDAIVHEGRVDEDVDLLEKPFGPDQLAGAVRKALDRRDSTGERR